MRSATKDCQDDCRLTKIMCNSAVRLHCLIDIDDFTLFNCKYGYEKGDKVLYGLGVLLETFAGDCYWVRLGSDEFYFSLSDASDIRSRKGLSNLMQKVIDELEVYISISIVRNEGITHPGKVLEKLKRNMQLAKVNGKNMMCES